MSAYPHIPVLGLSATAIRYLDNQRDMADELFDGNVASEMTLGEGIDGVILLRSTVSPILYKQQIGRALSAAKTRHAVIFDIVNNIENIYSIGTIVEEMQAAAAYYRSFGESEAIVTEHFHVIDAGKDCRVLFERLNDTLSASWNIMCGYAKAYYEEFGTLEISGRYRTKDGYSLGQ